MLEGLLYVILGAGIEDLIWIKGRIYNISEIMFKLVKHVEIMINLPTPSWNDIQVHKIYKLWFGGHFSFWTK